MSFGEFGPLSDKVTPIQIRKDARVLIYGIPHDLTKDEAARIAGIIQAFAQKEGSWVCNCCGSEEYSGAVSADSFEDDGLSCSGCGGTEFHWEGPERKTK